MNLDDMRIAINDFALTSGAGLISNSPPNLGPFVAKGHIRHIFGIKYQTMSGFPSGTSNSFAACVYDTWGTSNTLVDKCVVKSISGNPPEHIVTWPSSPRPDMSIGHIKESGVAQVYVSGIGFNVTMIYADRPGGF